jgi:hypothetical protein
MKDFLQWIPNFLKGMLEVLAKAQQMAGGRIRGHVVFWTMLILFFVFAALFLMWWSPSVYNNFSEFLSHFNIKIEQVNINIPSSLIPNLLLSFLLSIITLIFMISFGALIGSFLGTLFNIIFPGFTTYRIDKIFVELLPIINKVKEINSNKEIEQILNDVTKLQERWRTRFPNRVTRFLTTKTNREKFDKRKL